MHARGSAGTDLIFFIVFIIALGIVWVFTGGPDRSISHGSPFLQNPLGEGGLFGIPTTGGVGTSSYETSESIISRIGEGIVKLESGEEKSPYAEYVSISISTAKQTAPNEEYLTLKTARSVPGTLTISDWKLESTTSLKQATLGTAASLPHSGSVNAEAPITVGANATVYIVSGRSPIGNSFRINTCSGYLGEHQQFQPRLPVECPLPILELNSRQARSGFTPSPACSTFFSGLRQCVMNGTSAPQNLEPQCQEVLSSLSYNGCTSLHQSDSDFYKNEWRVYLRSDTELWGEQKERIRLLDERGRVIDVVSY